MRLADFLRTRREPILAEWEAFARTCAPASGAMDIAALRDHADEMLSAFATDLETPQSRHERSEKSKGRAPAPDGGAATAAEVHGAGRAVSGFSIEQMVAEYRALRASVLRLWCEEKGDFVTADVEDLLRFNEAIDQALAESVVRYSRELERAQEMFLAMLGHDLRTPLGAISTSAQFMLDAGEMEEPQRALSKGIARSAANTLKMVGDLLDFTRSRLGGGIPVVREETDLGQLLREIADEITAAHPEASIDVEVRDPQTGRWDRSRLRQALSNLIDNAVRHGDDGTPVTVTATGDAAEVSVAVHNGGTPIPAAQLNGIFSPMKPRARVRPPSARGPTGSLGLGLYISERIVSAHGGTIDVRSSADEGTTFTVRLPRGDSGDR